MIISFSFSTLDERLAKILEPGTPTPKERLETMRKCKEKGFLVGANFIPAPPFLSGSEEQLGEMIKTTKDYGADFVYKSLFRIFFKFEKRAVRLIRGFNNYYSQTDNFYNLF